MFAAVYLAVNSALLHFVHCVYSFVVRPPHRVYVVAQSRRYLLSRSLSSWKISKTALLFDLFMSGANFKDVFSITSGVTWQLRV
jgi:hypothetical protein